jgi:hypothetical protein
MSRSNYIDDGEMTQRQPDARVALRRAIAIFGPEADDTRVAAISFCYAHGIDPHWRRAVHPKFEPNFRDFDKPLDIDKSHAVSGWQDAIKRFVNDASE